MAKENVEIVVTADDQASSKLQSLAGKVSDSLEKFSNLGNLLAFGVVAKGFHDIYRDTKDQEEAMVSLGKMIDNTGVKFSEVKDEINKTTAALQAKTIYGDDAQMRALRELIMLTGNYQLSLQNLPLVLDMAAGMSTDVETASRYLGMALSGNVTMLGRYISEFRGAEAAGKSQAEILDILIKKYGGTAEAVGESAVAGVHKFNNALSNARAQIGEAILPIINKFLDAFLKLPESVRTVAVALSGLTTVLIALAPAIKEVNAATLTLIGTWGVAALAAYELKKALDWIRDKTIAKDINLQGIAFQQVLSNFEAYKSNIKSGVKDIEKAYQDLSSWIKATEEAIARVEKEHLDVTADFYKRKLEEMIAAREALNYKTKETAETEKQTIQETDEKREEEIWKSIERAERQSELENERLAKFQEIEDNIRQLGQDTTTQKKNQLEKEYKDKLAAYAKIKKSDKDYADYKAKLDEWLLAETIAIDATVAESKRQLALTTIQTTLQALETIFGESKEVAFAILAINKALAISEIWKTYAAMPWIAAAHTAAVVAEFMVLSKQIAGAGYETPEMPTFDARMKEWEEKQKEQEELQQRHEEQKRRMEQGEIGEAVGGGYRGGGGTGGGGSQITNIFNINFGLLTSITETQAQEIVDRLKPYFLDAEIGRG